MASMPSGNSRTSIPNLLNSGSPDRFFSLVASKPDKSNKMTSSDSAESNLKGFAGFTKGFSKISPEVPKVDTSSTSRISSASPVVSNPTLTPRPTSTSTSITLPSISSLPSVELGSDKIGNYGILPITAPVMAESELPPNLARARLSSPSLEYSSNPPSAPIPWESSSSTATLEPPKVPARPRSITPRGSCINTILGVSKRRKSRLLATKHSNSEFSGGHNLPFHPAMQSPAQLYSQALSNVHAEVQQDPQQSRYLDQSAVQPLIASRKPSLSIPDLESSRRSDASGSSATSSYSSPLVSPDPYRRSPGYQAAPNDVLYTHMQPQSQRLPVQPAHSSGYQFNATHQMVPHNQYQPVMMPMNQLQASQVTAQPMPSIPPVQPLQQLHQPSSMMRASIPITGSSTAKSVKNGGRSGQTSPHGSNPSVFSVGSVVAHSGRVGKQPVRDPEKLKHRVWLQQNRLHQDKLHQLGFRILEGHNGTKVCSLCNSSFSKEMFVWRHAWQHVTEKPFHCMVCNQKFTRSDTLQRHVRRTGHNFDAC